MTANRVSVGRVFWAATLVAVGGLLLARNFGYAIPAWRILAVYWPALIIGWGLLKLVDYFRFKDEGKSLFSAGEVAMLVFVLVVGTGFTAAANMDRDFGFLEVIGEEFDLFDMLGENHAFASSIEVAIDPDRVVEIRNRYGTIEVEPGDDGVLRVAIEKLVRASSADAATELEGELEFSIETEDGRYVVASNRNGLSEAVRRRFRTNLRVQAPAGSSLSIDNRYGAVRVTGLGGDQVVENGYGGIILNGIRGSVGVENRYGSVSVDDASGDVSVSNRYGRVTLNDIGGNVAVENAFAPVRLSGIGGSTAVSNAYATVEVSRASGDVRVDGRNSRVELEDIQGAVNVDASYRDVEGRNLRQSVNVATRHADVVLRFESAPTAPVTVTGEYADVRLELPPEPVFFLEAQVRSGSFLSEFDGFEREAACRDVRVTGATGDGGPRVSIRTSYGDVRIVR